MEKVVSEYEEICTVVEVGSSAWVKVGVEAIRIPGRVRGITPIRVIARNRYGRDLCLRIPGPD